MALNFGLLDTDLPGKIAGSYYAGQQERQKNMLAQQQVALQQQQMEQANALNRMKMDEYQRGLQEQNALRSSITPDFDISNPAHVNAILRASPTAGAAFLEKYSQGAKERAMAEKERAATLKSNLDASRSLLVGINDQPSYDAWRSYSIKNLPELANMLPTQFSTDTKDALLRTADDISKRLTAGPVVVAGSLVSPSGQLIYQAPEKPPAPPASVAEFERAQKDPAFMQFLQQRAAATRAPVQPVAPTIAQIVDPTNPNQMIAIDAKRYQGGGAGSPGVIGVSGKEPGAALRQNKVEAGKTQLADDLENLRSSFKTLDQMRAIPSTERNVVSNLLSATAASGVGQALGRAGGSAEQVERDVINSARQRLITSIKNATGMSAQQLNSNVELQTMLKSISDPGQSVQAALRIIDDIEQAYVKGTGELPKRNAGPATVPGKTNAPATATKPGSKLTAAEQAELEQLRQRFGK